MIGSIHITYRGKVGKKRKKKGEIRSKIVTISINQSAEQEGIEWAFRRGRRIQKLLGRRGILTFFAFFFLIYGADIANTGMGR